MGNRAGRNYLYSVSNRQTTAPDLLYVPREDEYWMVRLSAYVCYFLGYFAILFLSKKYWWYIVFEYIVVTWLWINVNAWKHKIFLSKMKKKKKKEQDEIDWQ